MSVKFPYEIQDSEIDSWLRDQVLVGPKKIAIPKKYAEFAEQYYNFQFRPDDILITGFMRSGTTCLQEMIWLMFNDFDLEKVKKEPSRQRIAFLEMDIAVDIFRKSEAGNEHAQKKFDKFLTLENFSVMAGRRIFKTHLPFSLLSPNLVKSECKIIYIARNPKDVIVSAYHFLKTLLNIVDSEDRMEDFFINNIKNDSIYYAPYWNQLQEAWKMRDLPNVKFIFYEELVGETRKCVKEISEFLGRSLSDQQLDLLENILEFDNFKKHYLETTEITTNNSDDSNADFLRKGIKGDWKNHFTKELNEKVEEWMKENIDRIGIKYPFEIYEQKH